MKHISILMYHQVGQFPSMREHRATYCDLGRFRRQMKWLQRTGYKVLNLDDAITALKNDEHLQEKYVVLTFDDAYENFYRNAFPLLNELGFPATVYAISGMIGEKAEWLAADGHQTPALMTATQLREVQAAGITVGSHSIHHLHLAELQKSLISREVTDSKAALEDILGVAVNHFCYPYGSHNKTCLEAVKQAGYLSATTCLRAAATRAFDRHALPRKAISFGDTLPGYWWKLVSKNKPKHQPVVIEPISQEKSVLTP